MQTIINIFTISGSILGIIAFLMTIFSSFHEHNIKKWEKLSSIIDFNDFNDFYNGVSIGIIYTNTSDKFRDLTRLIRNNSEEVQFKGLAKKKIEKLFSKILSETDKFYSEVQAPEWDVWKESREDIERKINKDYFDKKFDTHQEFSKHVDKSIENASNSIERIIALYREIYSLANRLPYEFLIKRI
ncbi:hypothetical protein GM418_30580 [Maribellus comscasis]|uniref:Uncharacterized protein n=1 Tax=Maribellus comscasis TaxID=2681766 RepID=A0A6I6JXG2_9BACT|nr:hypothetical protein [Maribellus comscasis]QGY47846.1 hypothetical protein GM418_30580 [Maribellus comscasis]